MLHNFTTTTCVLHTDRAIYGDAAFVLRQPKYWSEELKKRKAKQVDLKDLEARAVKYAKVRIKG